jgi:NAD(P)-dependent dehydrogenase (short-subunit alcohol dehydrogenase family)
LTGHLSLTHAVIGTGDLDSLAPGLFPSEMSAQYPPSYIESQMPRILLGRSGEPVELAAALVFLVSDAGSYITGQTIVVHVGVTVT